MPAAARRFLRPPPTTRSHVRRASPPPPLPGSPSPLLWNPPPSPPAHPPASQRSDGHRGTGSERMRARGRRPPIQNHRPSQQASRFPSPIELQRRHDEVRYRPVIVTSDSRSLLWFLSTPRRNSTLWVSFPVPILTDQSSPPPTRSGIHLYLANLREANDEHHCHQQAAEAVAGAVTCTST